MERCYEERQRRCESMKRSDVERQKEGINPPKKPEYLKIEPVKSDADKLKDEIEKMPKQRK